MYTFFLFSSFAGISLSPGELSFDASAQSPTLSLIITLSGQMMLKYSNRAQTS